MHSSETHLNESPNLLADNENDLAYHLACSRESVPGGPDIDLEPGQGRWLTAHFRASDGDRMPESYRHMLERLVDYQADCDRLDQAHRVAGGGLIPQADGAEEMPVPAQAAMLDGLFGFADRLALHYQKRVLTSLVATHVLAVLMGLSFVLYSENTDQVWLVLAFLGFFFAGYAVYRSGERLGWHRKYLDYRALAEGLRVQFYWSLAGVTDNATAVFAYDNFLQKQDVDLGWIRHVMRNAALSADPEEVTHADWVDWVVDDWVGNQVQGGGQLGYYRDKAALKSAAYRRTELLGAVSLWAGIAIAAVLFAAAAGMPPGWRSLLLVLMGILPLVAAVRGAYSHSKADKELIKQYQFYGAGIQQRQAPVGYGR